MSDQARPPREPIESPLEYPMRNGTFDQAAAIAVLAQPLPPAAPSARLLVGHEREIRTGLEAALGHHRDLVLGVLADLDASEDGLALGPLTSGLRDRPAAERREVEAALRRLGEGLADDLGKLSTHRDAAVRQRVLSVLGKVGGRRARFIIERALVAPEPSVRRAAMRAATRLVKHRDDGLVRELTRRLTAVRWQERVAAADSLGFLGAHADVDALLRALSDDEQAFVRAAAAVSLGRLRVPATVDELARAATAEHEIVVDVRLAAVGALRRTGGRAALAALAMVAKHDPDASVRAAVAAGKN